MVRISSNCWERWRARRERRPPGRLYHSVLEIKSDGERYVVELAPAWTPPFGIIGTIRGRNDRGVVATGAVGSRLLGWWPWFRYEVRCWPDGVIPDLEFAVGEPLVIPLSNERAQAMIDQVAKVPCHVWGRDVLGIRDMWNSNSAIAWVLQSGGVDAASMVPPTDGSAPGWAAGVLAAEQA